MDFFNPTLKQFKWVAILEGLSFLILLGIAMPLKYVCGMPETTRVVGMAHGILFMLYVFMVFMLYKPLNWNAKTTTLALVAAVLPFGPFVVDRKLLK